MQKVSMKLCGYALVAGIFGAFFRWVQLTRAVEADTGLFISGSRWSILLAAYLAAAAAVLFVLVRAQKNTAFPQSYPAVYAGSSCVAGIVGVVAGLILALGGVCTILYAMHTAATATPDFSGTVDYTPVFDLVLGLFAIGSGIAGAVFVVSPQKKKSVRGYGASTILVLFACFWLIAAYKYSANDPVLWNFSIRLLAIASSVLTFYYAAGFVFDKPHPLAALYFSLLTVILCTATLADTYPLGEQLIVLALLIFSLLLSAQQLNSSVRQTSCSDPQQEEPTDTPEI